MLNTSFWKKSRNPTLLFLNDKLDYHHLTTFDETDFKEHVLTFNKSGTYNLIFTFNHSDNYQFFINLETDVHLQLRIYFLNSIDMLKINLIYNLAPQASLKLLSSNENSKHFNLTNRFTLADLSNFYQYFHYNSPITEDNFVFLNHNGSEVKIVGGNYLINNTNLKQSWHITHNANNTKSSLLVKNVLDHRANAEFYALVKIPECIKNAATSVSNKNLLLSSEARITTKPQLEINAEEIFATHGASIGNISPEAVFYLQSRGLTVKDATRLLIKAFLEEIYELFPKFT